MEWSRWIVILMLSSFHAFSHAQLKIGVVPVSIENISLNARINHVLENNGVDKDSLKKSINASLVADIKKKLPGDSITSLNLDWRFVDTLRYTRTTVSQRKIDTSDWWPATVEINRESKVYKYRGIRFNDHSKHLLKRWFKESGNDYIVFINRFEAQKKALFSPYTRFTLHFEVYDRNVNKVYGGKSELSKRIKKSVYLKVLQYFLERMYDQFSDRIRTELAR